MPGLMAEWLEAIEMQATLVRLSPKTDFDSPSWGSDQKGKNATYKNAKMRLNGFECAFVTVQLEGNETEFTSCDLLSNHHKDDFDSGRKQLPPHTNPHVHPGDEYILVRRGSIHLRLDNSGTFTVLDEGDYVHFNAEVPHSLWNLHRVVCEAIVVRFFQLERHGTRAKQSAVLDEIRERLDKLGDLYDEGASGPSTESLAKIARDKDAEGRELLALWDQIHAWVRDRTRPPRDRLRSRESSRKLLDHVGLSAFMTAFFAQEFPEDQNPNAMRPAENSLRQWYRQHTRQEHDWGARVAFRKLLRAYLKDIFGEQADQFEQYLTGVSHPGNTDSDDVTNLSLLAKKLRIPRILLDGYLAPPVMRTVVVRGATRSEKQYGFDYIPDPDPDANNARNAKYWIPARTLVNSDMSITLLAHAGSSTQSETDWNRHPGFEVLIPLRGSVQVEFRNRSLAAGEGKCEKDQMLVYRSSWSHRVRLSEGTQVLVMRFNIVDRLAIESYATPAKGSDSKATDRDGGSTQINMADESLEPPYSFSQKKHVRKDTATFLVAALTEHHDYSGGSCMNTDPITVAELAERTGVSKATVSDFMKKKFGSHALYKAYCSDRRLVDSLKLMNNEFTPRAVFGRTPPNEGERESNE